MCRFVLSMSCRRCGGNLYISRHIVCSSLPDLSQTKAVGEAESENIIQWFAFNNMQANPEKFNAMVLERRAYDGCKSFRVTDTDISCEVSMILLGVTVDYLLNFDLHIFNMCKKAANQINILFRLSNYTNMETILLIYKSFIRSIQLLSTGLALLL